MSSSSRSFTWLHLSDLHLADNDYDQDIVTRALLRDLPALLARDNLRPDCVFFTGDITRHGSDTEFAKAAKFFKALKNCVHPTLNSAGLLVVPGNHDVHWPLVSITANTVDISAFHTEGAIHDVFHQPERTVYLQGLQNYFAFSRQNIVKGSMATMDQLDSWFWSRLLRSSAGLRIGLIGLTTSWRCCEALRGSEPGHLLLGVFGLRQTLESWKALAPDKQPDLIIVLGHHPVSWLSEVEQSPTSNLISKNVDIFLRGHEHRAQCTYQQSIAGAHLEYAAGAIFTDEDSVRRTGLRFAAGVVRPDESAGTIYSYKYKEEGGNEKWLPDHEFAESSTHTYPFSIRPDTNRSDCVATSHRPVGVNDDNARPRYRLRAVTAVGLLCALAIATALIIVFAQGQDRISIALTDTPRHLGDNVFASIGVMEPSPVRAPSGDEHNGLIWLDKGLGEITLTSLPTLVIPFIRELQALYSQYDLSTYQHVRLVQTSDLAAMPPKKRGPPYAEPFGASWLVWDTGAGNFHLQRAAVALCHVWDMKSELEARNIQYDTVELVDANLVIRISHGGHPQGDGGSILLRLNDATHDIAELLVHETGQHPEVLKISVKNDLNMTGDSFNVLGLATTPIQERTPIPWEPSGRSSPGPAHFRDITVYSVALQLSLKHEKR
ncbi:MAG: metallophosphoesterase [Phycisphaerae bacterium]|nr:metallophosphoesterase [Phycisphaerae bacterium]